MAEAGSHVQKSGFTFEYQSSGAGIRTMSFMAYHRPAPWPWRAASMFPVPRAVLTTSI